MTRTQDKPPCEQCGCTCFICTEGHLLGLEEWHEHTQGCRARYWKRADEKISDFSP